MNKYINLIMFCLFTINLTAQNVPFNRKLFSNDKEGYKNAIDHIRKGDEALLYVDYKKLSSLTKSDQYGMNFKKAISEYEVAYLFNPNSAILNYKLAYCYYNTNKYNMAKYINAECLSVFGIHETTYYKGVSLHLNGEYESAIKMYTEFIIIDESKSLKLSKDAQRKIEECNNAINLEGSQTRVFINNIGGTINTSYFDYSPVISTDESVLLFTSQRPGVEILTNQNTYYEDVYFSEYKNNKWSLSQNVGDTINIIGQHDATIGLSPDGNDLFIYNNKKGGGDILISKKNNGVWGTPIELNSNINTPSHEPDASLSSDGKTLYFTSNKPGGFGHHDIYYSKWNREKNDWGEAVNLGSNINTKYDDKSVFIHPDGETMYFASKGHNTIGGYDLFYSKLVNGEWQKPTNFGSPLNTPDDDLKLVVSGSGRFGYYSSTKNDGLGGKDIYMVTFLGNEKEPIEASENNFIASILKPIVQNNDDNKLMSQGSNMSLLTGAVTDDNGKPLKAEVNVYDNETNEHITTVFSDPITGKYLVSLPNGRNYGVNINKNKHLFHSENFNIPKNSGFKKYEINVKLQKIDVGSKMILKNIFFDLAKFSLRKESILELDRVVKLMNENPSIKVEISGHTDTRGSYEKNTTLSNNRANEVIKYLIENGVSSNRMVGVGYGASNPIASDSEITKVKSKTEKEVLHQKNRRTEFKIISI